MSYDGRIQGREPLATLPASAVPVREKKQKQPAEWRPMTEAECRLAGALGRCTFVPGTNQKRFARNIAAQAAADEPKITNKQREYLHKMVHRYRRQIPVEILELRLDDAEAKAAAYTQDGERG